ncbi:MAG: hypothetical protein WC916_05035 [Candidatus Woesearchaeota archaeon]
MKQESKSIPIQNINCLIQKRRITGRYHINYTGVIEDPYKTLINLEKASHHIDRYDYNCVHRELTALTNLGLQKASLGRNQPYHVSHAKILDFIQDANEFNRLNMEQIVDYFTASYEKTPGSDYAMQKGCLYFSGLTAINAGNDKFNVRETASQLIIGQTFSRKYSLGYQEPLEKYPYDHTGLRNRVIAFMTNPQIMLCKQTTGSYVELKIAMLEKPKKTNHEAIQKPKISIITESEYSKLPDTTRFTFQTQERIYHLPYAWFAYHYRE